MLWALNPSKGLKIAFLYEGRHRQQPPVKNLRVVEWEAGSYSCSLRPRCRGSGNGWMGPRWSDQGQAGANEGRGAVSHPAATWHGAQAPGDRWCQRWSGQDGVRRRSDFNPKADPSSPSLFLHHHTTLPELCERTTNRHKILLESVAWGVLLPNIHPSGGFWQPLAKCSLSQLLLNLTSGSCQTFSFLLVLPHWEEGYLTRERESRDPSIPHLHSKIREENVYKYVYQQKNLHFGEALLSFINAMWICQAPNPHSSIVYMHLAVVILFSSKQKYTLS